MDKVLIIRFGPLGDVAISIPVVYNVALNYPQHKFYLLTKKQFTPIFVDTPPNLTIIPIDLGVSDGFWGLNKFYNSNLKPLGITKVADISNILRAWILDARLIAGGAVVRCREKVKRDSEKLLRRKNKDMSPLKPYYARYADVFRSLGYDVKYEFKAFDVPAPKTFDFDSSLKYVGVAPFSAHERKVYSLERTKRVVEMLSGLPQVKVLLFGGGANEKQILESWAAEFSNVESMVGRFSMVEELGVMKKLNVMLSMDSANMHLCSLVGTPVVSVWGPSHPYVGFYAWGQPLSNAVQLDLPCRPCSECGAEPCYRGDMACMDIPCQNVFLKIKEFL